MNEIQFLHKNSKKWKEFEAYLDKKTPANPDKVGEMFIHLTDDLAYARSFYPNSKVSNYLNQLTQKAHQIIYQNPPKKKNRIKAFWLSEFPLLVYNSRKEVMVSFIILLISTFIGIVSNKYDNGFIRIILGNRYVNMTMANIASGDPLAVYKSMNQVDMFLGITINNIRVSFFAFVFGLLSPIASGFIIMRNGIMLGTFQSFLASKGFLLDSIATIWVHGTFEIFAITVAGGAGIIVGNSIIFPKSYSRAESFKHGALKGSKIIIGLIPVFIIAGFLEGFITRYTHSPYAIRFAIILASLTTIIYYFYFYPNQLTKNQNNEKSGN